MLARPGEALPALAETTPLSEAETADLYRAMSRDACRTVADSGGELLVNYPEGRADLAREVVANAGLDEESVRREVQAGSTFAARAGNAVTHLLREEAVDTAAVLTPTAPLLGRTVVDSAAMRLRSEGVVLGPDAAGDVYFAGFAETIDFTDAYDPPAVETLARRSVAADQSVGFLPQLTGVRTGGDLRAVLAGIDARRVAGRAVPAETAACLDDVGLTVEGEELRRPGGGSP